MRDGQWVGGRWARNWSLVSTGAHLADRLFLHRLHVLINIVFVRDDQQGNRHRSHDPPVVRFRRGQHACE